MAELLVALAVFTGFHLLPSTPLRSRAIELLGRKPFQWAFSAASLLLFAWVWVAWRDAPVETVLWTTGAAVRWVSALAMLFAVLLAVLAVVQSPRVLLTAEAALAGDGALKGVVRITRHPLLWAIGLWGIVHMINNADAPGLVFFGYVTALALGGTWLIDRRRARLLGPRWTEVAAQTSNLPFVAIADGRTRLVWSEFAPQAVAGAAALWLLLLLAHPWVLGVPAVIL